MFSIVQNTVIIIYGYIRNTHIHTLTHTYTHTQTLTHTYTPTHTHTRIPTHSHTHTHTHTPTHTHPHILYIYIYIIYIVVCICSTTKLTVIGYYLIVPTLFNLKFIDLYKMMRDFLLVFKYATVKQISLYLLQHPHTPIQVR